jgi:hypothetical protein
LKVKAALLTSIAIFAAIVSIQSQSVYAAVSITSVSWNETTVQRFDQVAPSEDRPLEFNFVSRDDENNGDEDNNDLPANFQCAIYRINDNADMKRDNIPNGIDLDGNGIGDIAQSDLDHVSSDNCGTNIANDRIAYKSVLEGGNIFIVIADPLASGEPITSAVFPFFVPPFAVAGTDADASSSFIISSVTWNDVIIQPFDPVIPSQDRPLEFSFQLDNENNKDVSYNFQCAIYRINDNADVKRDNIPNGIDLDGNGIGDIAQYDLEHVSSDDNCGSTTSKNGQISYTNFIQGIGFREGSYVFIVTADPLATGEKITRTAFPFIIPLQQVEKIIKEQKSND